MAAVRGFLLQMSKRRWSVHSRHPDVEKDKIGMPLGGDRKPFLAGIAGVHLEFAVEVEHDRHELADIGLVVNLKYAQEPHAASLSSEGMQLPNWVPASSCCASYDLMCAYFLSGSVQG
jgi:hypothetical protein